MASSSAAAVPRRRAGSPAPSLTGPASDVHPVLRRTTAPPAALDLLAKARSGLDEPPCSTSPTSGIAASGGDADDVLRDAAMFLRLVERLLVLQPDLPQPRAEQPGGG
ncbi:hypothetical protein SCALM49S_02079 [Streptomyces californicus]